MESKITELQSKYYLEAKNHHGNWNIPVGFTKEELLSVKSKIEKVLELGR